MLKTDSLTFYLNPWWRLHIRFGPVEHLNHCTHHLQLMISKCTTILSSSSLPMLALLIVNLFVCSLYYLDVLHVQRILNEHTNESCSFYSVLNECLSDTENILYECMWRFLYKDVGVVWVCVCVRVCKRVYKSLCMFASVCQRQTCSIRWTLLTLAHFSCISSLIVPLSLPLSVRILFVIDVLFCAVDFFQCFFPFCYSFEFTSWVQLTQQDEFHSSFSVGLPTGKWISNKLSDDDDDDYDRPRRYNIVTDTDRPGDPYLFATVDSPLALLG